MSTSTTGAAHEAATDAPAQPPALSAAAVNIPESLGYRVKRKVLGKPLVNDQLYGEKLSRPIALGVLAPDCISSSAYGTEQMLTQLVPVFGLAGFALVMPITGVILVLLVVLTLCYRDVVSVYTKAGGSYVVAREQFGVKVAQIAAVALLIDYIVTVAVQIAAGTIAVSSWLSLTFNIDITGWSIWISVAMICLLCYGNLRGIREAGRTFAIPMYFYVTMIGLTVIAGVIRLILGDLPQADNFADGRYGGALGGQLEAGAGTHAILTFAAISGLLRAFANGGSSLTGLEAISNGVSAFRKPAGRNARKSMFWMSTMLGSLVLGISILAWKSHTTPYSSGSPSVLGQLSSLIWGHGAFGNIMLTIVQLATALILYTGGNTSFNGFPFLASFVAEDSFLPRQFLHRGHRLTFSNGIIVLAIVSLLLLIGTDGNLTRLVSLYAIGVFTGFTMAAAGLFRYHKRRNERNRTIKLLINGTACVLSAAVVVIFAVFKFTEGAWMVVVVFPIGVFALIKLNERYRREAAALAGAPASASLPTLTRTTVLVLVDSVDLAVIKALRYARSLRPVELRAVHLMIDSRHAEHLRKRWDASTAADVPLEVIEVPDRRLRRAAAELAARTARGDRNRGHHHAAAARLPRDQPPAARPHGGQDRRRGLPAAARGGHDRALRRGRGDRGDAGGDGRGRRGQGDPRRQGQARQRRSAPATACPRAPPAARRRCCSTPSARSRKTSPRRARAPRPAAPSRCAKSAGATGRRSRAGSAACTSAPSPARPRWKRSSTTRPAASPSSSSAADPSPASSPARRSAWRAWSVRPKAIWR